MANGPYPSALDAWLDGDIDWVSDTIKVALVSSAYVRNPGHEFFDDVTGVLGTPTALTGKTSSGGVLDAAAVSYPGVLLGETVAGLVHYKDTGTPSLSPVLFFSDENDDGTPISRAGDGSDIVILWSATAAKIAQFA